MNTREIRSKVAQTIIDRVHPTFFDKIRSFADLRQLSDYQHRQLAIGETSGNYYIKGLAVNLETSQTYLKIDVFSDPMDFEDNLDPNSKVFYPFTPIDCFERAAAFYQELKDLGGLDLIARGLLACMNPSLHTLTSICEGFWSRASQSPILTILAEREDLPKSLWGFDQVMPDYEKLFTTLPTWIAPGYYSTLYLPILTEKIVECAAYLMNVCTATEKKVYETFTYELQTKFPYISRDTMALYYATVCALELPRDWKPSSDDYYLAEHDFFAAMTHFKPAYDFEWVTDPSRENHACLFRYDLERSIRAALDASIGEGF